MPPSVPDAFDSLLRGDPDACVCWTPTGERDRRDLDRRAAEVAAVLEAVTRGRRVGICVRDPFTFLAAFLALSRRGDAAVLFDAADPRAPRLDLAERFELAAMVVDVPELRVLELPGAAAAGTCRAIKLTSGSTGEPNAIAVDDAQLRADADALERTMGIGDGDRVFAAVPMSFSYGVGNLLIPALARGRELVLPAPGPVGLLAAMRRARPTVLPAVPALLRALLRGSAPLPDSMRLVLSAGAKLPAEVARSFRQRFG
ncbi:MAG: AMP-binding protein, partial [Planctomycetes bacterium]|nr:AMP-binding protein [Planctomycetota bacterium]